MFRQANLSLVIKEHPHGLNSPSQIPKLHRGWMLFQLALIQSLIPELYTVQ